MRKSLIFFPAAIAILILAVFLVNKKGKELSQPVNFMEATQPVIMDNPELNKTPEEIATITDEALGDETLPLKHTNVVPFTSQAPYAKWDRLHDEACEEASLMMAHYYLAGQDKLEMRAVEDELQKMVAFQKTYFGSHKDLTAEEMIELAKEFYQEEYSLIQLVKPEPEVLVEEKIATNKTADKQMNTAVSPPSALSSDDRPGMWPEIDPESMEEDFENTEDDNAVNEKEKDNNKPTVISAAELAEKMNLVFQEKIKYMTKELAKGNIFIVPAAGQVLENPYFRNDGPLYHALVIIGYDNEKKEFIVNDPGTRRGEGFRYSYENLWKAIHDFPGKKSNILKGDKNVILVKKEISI